MSPSFQASNLTEGLPGSRSNTGAAARWQTHGNCCSSAVQRSECRLRCVGWELGGGDGITVGGGENGEGMKNMGAVPPCGNYKGRNAQVFLLLN